MTFNNKIKWILFTIVAFSFLVFKLNDLVTFQGDELGTLDLEKIHKPIPYKIIVSFILSFFLKIPENIFLFRLTSLIFSLISIVFWYKYFLNNTNEILVFNFMILTSSFIIRESMYFRYYSYYFLTSTIFLVYAINISKKYNLNIKILFTLILTFLSPYCFFILNLIQYIFYIFIIFLFDVFKKIKYRYLLISLLIISISILIINPNIVWFPLNYFNLSDIATNLESKQIRGLSIGSFIKPLYAIFQFFFGYDTYPTDSFLFIILIIILSFLLLYVLYRIYIIDKKLFSIYFFCFILPFLILYLILEPISMPGFTQLETKHGMFLYPMVLIVVIKSSNYINNNLSYFLFSIIFLIQLFGISKTFSRLDTNWYFINEKIENFFIDNKNTRILLDGRSNLPFNFYSKNIIDQESPTYTWESQNKIIEFLNKNEIFVLILNDYKSYTPLKLNQNWNAGTNSISRFNDLNKIIENINIQYKLMDSYISYPTFVYFFEKKIIQSNIKSFGVWEHHLKDVFLPVESNNKKIISSLLISPSDSLIIENNNQLIVNIEGNSEKIEYGEKVGYYSINKQNFNLINGQNIWSIFSEYYNLPYDENKVFYNWYHRPLVSGSIKYPGSYFKHKANIFSISIKNYNSDFIIIKNTTKEYFIRVWI